MNLDNVLVRNSNLIIDDVEDEVIVFNESTQNTHILNDVAGFLLKNADNITAKEVIGRLYDQLSAEDQKTYSLMEISDDCVTFIKELVEQGLLYIA